MYYGGALTLGSDGIEILREFAENYAGEAECFMFFLRLPSNHATLLLRNSMQI